MPPLLFTAVKFNVISLPKLLDECNVSLIYSSSVDTERPYGCS